MLSFSIEHAPFILPCPPLLQNFHFNNLCFSASKHPKSQHSLTLLYLSVIGHHQQLSRSFSPLKPRFRSPKLSNQALLHGLTIDADQTSHYWTHLELHGRAPSTFDSDPYPQAEPKGMTRHNASAASMGRVWERKCTTYLAHFQHCNQLIAALFI